MERHLYRTASWVLVVVVLASSLAAILGTASASSTTTYALTGFVDQTGGANAPPVPAGVTVDLVSRATGAVYSTTVTGSGGQFTFTSSSTSNGLVPGYWGLYVPAATNVSLTGCKRCAVLPQQQTPTYQYFSAAVLTNSTNYSQTITNVQIVPYVATLNGTVTLNGSAVAGASVRVLAPYSGLSLISNTTNATGFYNISAPEGTWVVQVTYTPGAKIFTNSTNLTITSTKPPHFNPTLAPYSISGRIYSSKTGSYVPYVGNATLYDPVSRNIYTDVTAPGGYYSFASYPANFTSGHQKFYVVVAPTGFEPAWYTVWVNSSAPISQKVTVNPATTPSRLGALETVLNLTTLNVLTGKGTIAVNSTVALGNDSVMPALPNASVGQLWAQLGLDFNHTLTLLSAQLSSVKSWVAAQGPVFPAIQAGLAINGTTFYQASPTQPQPLSGSSGYWRSTCTATACGLSSPATINYGWNTSYTLNGTIPKNASSYSLSFGFAHPQSSSLVYNYTIDLPKGYVLTANTTAPAQTSLVGRGPSGTWTTFTLVSKWSATPSATATFTVVRESNITANVAISSTNTTFTSGNILNDTHKGYAVVAGVGMNLTFSAAPSVYPKGLNGTVFHWYFGFSGKGNWSNTTNITTNYTYHTASPATDGKVTPYNGNLTITSSSGIRNTTWFNISVVNSKPSAKIASNASKAQNRTAGGVPFLFVNWTTTLQFNATATALSAPNNLSIAQYTLKTVNFTSSANFSTAKGGNPRANWTVAFGANTTSPTTSPGHGVYINLATVMFNGTPSGVKGWGWIYNLTMNVWTIVGTNSTARLTILVNDTQPPVPKITLMNSAGKAITNNSIVEGPNHYAVVKLNGSGSSDYGNGSLVYYNWTLNNTNTSTSFKNHTLSYTSVRPNGSLPSVQLGPKSTPYKIKLTVTDKNGNKANTTVSLEVAENTTIRPLLAANNLTGPASVTAGSSYTYWVNVTVGGGSKSVAQDVQVAFYLLSPSGTGSRTYIGGAPTSVIFYGYKNVSGNVTVNSTPLGTGSISNLKFNKTVRAVITWTPSKSGSFLLYANATAENQFVNGSSGSVASTAITVHANPTTQALEYGGVAAAVVAVLVVLVLYFRRRNRKPGTGKPTSGKSGLERSSKPADDDE